MDGEVVERGKYDVQFGSYIWPVRGGIEALPTTVTQTKTLTKTVAAAVAAVTLSVTTTSLPAGTIGTTYSQTLAATGGTTPYTWSKKSGTLPAGLTLSSAGVISGKPTTAGTSTFAVQVKDKAAKLATKALSITVGATPATPPSITTAALADGVIAVTYSQTLTATGGKTPYTWSKTVGSLPAGLALSTTGVISGKPTAAGNSSFTVQVKDGNNAVATKPLAITVAPPLSIATTTLPEGSVGSSYNQSIAASGGKAPYTWSITSGSLPPGLVIAASSGAVSGTPTTSGWSYFTIQVKDANNSSVSAPLSLNINVPLSISTTTLSGNFSGIPYSQTLSAIGGSPPYTWSIAAGALPAGLLLDPVSGTISGSPTLTGTSSFTVQVRDAGNAVSSGAYTVNITEFGSIHGSVTDQSTGATIAGATVTLNLSGITSKNASDFIYTCAGTLIAANDYGKIAENDDVKLGCNAHNYTQAKVRNPYGVADPFTMRWNGISAYSGGEYLAQSFKPTKNGILNRVSFYFSGFSVMYGTQGSVSVQLKSSLGGDRGVYLATSAVKTVTSGTLTGWVDFDFTVPVTVTAGQEYFIELQGDFATWPFMSGTTYYDAALWGNGIQYPDGRSYQRNGGVWGQLGSSLAFRTYVDANPDITTTLPTQSIDIHGAASFAPNIELSNVSSGVSEKCYFDYGGNPESYGNSGDYNCTKTVSGGSNYYDQNGWITVTLYSQSSYNSYSEMDTTLLVTDQFSLTFNRTLTTVTDVSGAYSFAGLPDGNYALTFDKPAYMPATSTGSLTPGQSVNLASSLDKALPATLRGTVQHPNFGAIDGATVTVTDALGGNKTAISDSSGNYLVDGILSGNYSVTYAAPQLISQTVTGTLSPGEVQTKNIWMYGAPVTLSVDSPVDGALVAVVPLVLTGSTLNAETVTIIATNNNNSVYYTATLANGVYTASIPLAAGQTNITVLASSAYNQQAVKYLAVTLAPFTLRNLGDSGNIAIMETTGSYDAKNADGSSNNLPRQELAKEYIRSHGDNTDFLIYLSTFDYAMPEATVQGFYQPVRNDVLGINRQLMDNTAAFGSAGKLQGTVDLGNVTTLAANLNGPKLNETVTTLSHELAHRFSAHVKFKNPDGTLNSSLIGKDSSHWSYLLDSKGSLMYGNGWKDNGDGTFTSVAKESGFSPLDLYLMGMIPKEQVPPMMLIDNTSIDKTKLPHLGDIITGTAKTVTIDDIVAAEGERIPNAATAQKQFNVGFVLLTRAGDNTTAATQVIETLRKAWAGRFAELTQWKANVGNIAASLEVAIDSPADGATIVGPDVTVSGSFINSTGVETGVTVNGIPATVTGNRFIVNHVPLQLGANSIVVTANDANGLTNSATRNVTAAPGNYIRISSNIESGTGPLDASLRINASFIVTAPTINITGPGGTTITAISDTEYSATFTSEGVYTVTVTATDPDGQIYTDRVIITVMSRCQLETLLRGKWEGMKAAVTSGATEDALKYFVFGIQDRIRAIITDSESAIIVRLSEISRLELFTATGRAVQAGAIRMESDGEYAYPVNFVTDENGVWKIMGF